MAVRSKVVFIKEHVEHRGYINVFPFCMGMMYAGGPEGESAAGKALLDLLEDEEELLAEEGIRSLSKADKEYTTEDNYWRGPVWMPLNYLFLRAAKKYYWHLPRVQAVYA